MPYAVEVGNPMDNPNPRFPGQVGSLTADEQQAHFSLWAAFKSPLVIGSDPRQLSQDALKILKNAEVLATNQDPLATPVRLVSSAYSVAPMAATTDGWSEPSQVSAVGCAGYLVTGAGSADVNGCYREHKQQQAKDSQKPHWILDSAHQLYSWNGLWHLGDAGISVSYTTVATSPVPPESSGGCGKIWKSVKGQIPW